MSIAPPGPAWPPTPTVADSDSIGFDDWRADVRGRVLGEVVDFLREVRIDASLWPGAEDVLRQYATGGKGLRSTFMYLGWLCGAEPDVAALRAAASLELVHAFALLQDDVMDDAALRRGEPAAHVRFSRGYRHDDATAALRFGASAAILLGDMCLVWSEQMLRQSGLEASAAARVWPRYDAMRIELAIGQYTDLTNDVRRRPTMDDVLAIARAKSGNYTVARPLQLGAAMAGCDDGVLNMLTRYGTRIGEAFQLRDDLLGIFGSAAVTGKPEDSDLGQHKATTVVVAALDAATPAMRRELSELVGRPVLDHAALERCRDLIDASGAPERVEAMITDRVDDALHALDDGPLPPGRRTALEQMALLCTARQQ